jgi:hypothetical protein
MTPSAPPLQVLDVDQVAELLRCAPKTVQERARLGELPGLMWGRDWVFPVGALARRLDELALANKPAPAAASPSAVLVQMNAGKRPRRAPPALPQV